MTRSSRFPGGTLIVRSSPVKPEDGGYAVGSRFSSYDVEASLRLNAFDIGMTFVDRAGVVWRVVNGKHHQILVRI